MSGWPPRLEVALPQAAALRGRYGLSRSQRLGPIGRARPLGPPTRLRRCESKRLSVALSPDGHRAVSGSMDGSVHVWDLDTGKELRRLAGHQGSWDTVTGFLPDGHRVLSGGLDRHVRL